MLSFRLLAKVEKSYDELAMYVSMIHIIILNIYTLPGVPSTNIFPSTGPPFYPPPWKLICYSFRCCPVLDLCVLLQISINAGNVREIPNMILALDTH